MFDNIKASIATLSIRVSQLVNTKYYTKAEAHAEAERLNKLYDEPAFLYIPVLVRDVRWSILKERIA